MRRGIFSIILLALGLTSGLLLLPKVYTVSAASLYLTANTVRLPRGNTFTVYPTVNTAGVSTNAYDVRISFPADMVEPIGISRSGSICSLFTGNPSYTASTAQWSCGLPSPGYKGGAGRIGAITFRAKKIGNGTIYVTGNSVLANDGAGTNVLTSKGAISFTITEPPPPPIPSPQITASVGNSKGWYNPGQVKFTWTKPNGATGFTYSFSKNKNATPAKSGANLTQEYVANNIGEGVWYFKVQAVGSKGQWSNPATYRLQVDKTPPVFGDGSKNSTPADGIVIDPQGEVDKLPTVSFNAIDKLSGIDHYEIKLDDSEFITAKTGHLISQINSGAHVVTVRAFDKAGNFSEQSLSFTVATVPAPTINQPKVGETLPLSKPLQISGQSEPNAKVIINLNGEFLAEVTADPSGYFTYTHTQLLFEGEYRLTAEAVNVGGIRSKPSDAVTFTIDPYTFNVAGVSVQTYYLLFCICGIMLALVIAILFLIFWRFKDRKKAKKVPLQDISQSAAGS